MSHNLELLNRYIDYLDTVRNYTYATTNHNRSVCRRWIEFLTTQGIGDPRRAQAQHVLAWVNRERNRDIAEQSVGRELCILRTFYGFLVSFYDSSNPTVCLPEFICRPRAEQTYLTVDQMFSILETLDTANPFGLRNYVLIALLWSTGLRSRELCALQWQDIDFDHATLLVRKGKGNKQRQLFLNDRLLKDLGKYRRGLLAGPATPVFCQYPNSRKKGVYDCALTNRYLGQIIREAAADAGIQKKVTTLTLRHTFATHMYEAGISVADIKEMMGHDSTSETTIYIHVTMKAIRQILNQHVQHTHHLRKDRP